MKQFETYKPVMVLSVVSSSTAAGNSIFFLDANFVENDRNVRFVLFTKISSDLLYRKMFLCISDYQAHRSN